jgi:hypothetical protein
MVKLNFTKENHKGVVVVGEALKVYTSFNLGGNVHEAYP